AGEVEHQRVSEEVTVTDAADLPPDGDGTRHRRLIASRVQHHGLGRKARTRAHQPFQLTTRLQFLETPERRDHLLTHLVAVAAALDDLQIGAPGRGLAAEVHGIGSACRCAHRAAISPQKSNQIDKTWHYTFAKVLPHTKQNQRLMPRQPMRTVEDGLDVSNSAQSSEPS